MPRGPFQGTWVSGIRPTIVTAPDALVHINGSPDAVSCPVCRKSFPFNRYITNIQVDLSIDSAPGNASFTMSIPRHAVDDFYFEGEPIICEMMEVEVYAKGYYLVEGIPQYYPVFWGLVTEVSDAYSGGEHTVTVHCQDILKWFELCKMAINSAMSSPHPGSLGMSIFGNVFFGMNPYDIIWTLAQQSFGDIIVGTGNLASNYREGTQRKTFVAAMGEMMRYWEERFQRIRSSLLLYGINGVAVRGDSLYQAMRKGNDGQKLNKSIASVAVSRANGGSDGGQAVYDPTSPDVVAFRSTYNVNVPLWSSEYQTKLELATAAKTAIGFEFYMDVDGSIVFKPPFYNLDILSNKPISWIQDIDIIDWDFSRSEAEVVTQVILQGSLFGNIDVGVGGEEMTPFTSVTDYHLLGQYGWRSEPYNSEFMGNTDTMFYLGLDVLDRLNSRRNRATVTIPMRPELRLGFPVYVAPKDQIWYVSGISHNIAFGGRATTSLTLTARRKKFIAPRGMGVLKRKMNPGGVPRSGPGNSSIQYSTQQLAQFASFDLTVGEAGSLPPTEPSTPGEPSPRDPLILRHPKTGKLVGYPNAVMVFSQPFAASTAQTKQDAGIKPKPAGKAPKGADLATAALGTVDTEIYAKYQADNKDTRLRDKYLSNRTQYGLNSAGAYVYAHDVGDGSSGGSAQSPGYIQEILILPGSRISSTNDLVKKIKNSSALIRPVSDERGFEVVGVFRYGRGVSLRDGRLVLQTGQKNQVANVDAQVALAGDLFATLNAQSQGLTSHISTYENPADALSRLTPEDLQTAGFINPDVGRQPVFAHTEDNFVDSAPLGSPQQQGLPTSVEASLLSKALTLTEMTSMTDPGTPRNLSCTCLLGRSDLTFLSYGYNIKTLSSPAATTPDNSTLDSSGLFSSMTDPSQQAPINSSAGSLLNRQEMSNRVDDFLFNLYSQLDDVHQQYEHLLRGEPQFIDDTLAEGLANTDARLAQDVRFGSNAEAANIKPPFSASTRASIGDPTALALLANSSLTSLSDSFQSFGQTLQTNAQLAQLQGDISAKTNQIQSLQTQINSIQSAVSYIGDRTNTLQSLQAQLVKAQQALQDDQTRLAQLQASKP